MTPGGGAGKMGGNCICECPVACGGSGGRRWGAGLLKLCVRPPLDLI